ncbi:MAG: hypothetical protein GKR88_13720 [Flavobacteriaceae bacterium]|nr:MAG: hypothetical protein GKR88_13720 [Flavobacteriaceae bacterium]
MKTSYYIRDKIDRLPKGYVFTYIDFITDVNRREAVIKYLNRMVASGEINKLSKGKYYKAEKSVFGDLPVEQYQIVKDLLEKNGKTIGYLTGYGYYNSIGLTTQVSNIIQIGKNEVRLALKRGRFKISFIKQKNTITKQNIPLLRLLDTIRYIKRIPDAPIDTSCYRLLVLLKELGEKERRLLIKLALKYPPMTRALLGALLEQLKISQDLGNLKRSLNPITAYKLLVSEKILPTTKNWNIR